MSDPLFDTMLEKYDNHNYFAEANLLKNQVQDNTNKDVDISVEFPLAEKKDFDFTPIPDNFDAGDNTLIKYHQDTIRNNNVLYEDNKPTTIYINGIKNPDDPNSPIYAVPGYVDGKKINNEQELQRIAKEKNWFNIYPSDPDSASHQLRVNKVKNIINADGQKLNQQNRTVTDRVKDFGLDTGQAMITGAEKAGRNFNDFIAEVIASPDTLGDFIGQKITGNPDFNYPGIDKETATKNIQAGLTWFDENLVPEFARGSTANIERKYTNELYGSILEGISEFATGAVPAAKVVGLTKGMYGLFAPSAAVRGMAWGMIADATVIDPNSQELIAPVIRKFVLGLDDNERTALSDTVLSILEKNDPNSDVTNRIKTANEGAVIGALVEGIIYGAKVLPWKTFTKALGVVGTASLAAGKKVVDTAKRIEIDDSTLGSTNIPLRLKPKVLSSIDLIQADKSPIVGTGKKNKVLVDDILNYFDQGNKLDLNNPKDITKIVDDSVAEINYQLKQENTGLGWYDDDVKEAMRLLDQINPKFVNNGQAKDLVIFLTSIASPGIGVGLDFRVGTQITDIFLDTGKISTTNPNTGKGWTRRPHLPKQLEFVQKYIDDKGLPAFLQFLHTPTTRKQVNALRKEYGIKPVAGSLYNEIRGADIFGPKVSSFMANMLGVADENVPDVWFTRGFNRKAGNMTVITKDGERSFASQPRNLSERNIMNSVLASISEKVNLNKRDTQAVLWYFEQGLYTKLGVKSEPKSYADITRQTLERKANVNN
nr:hypothetical protein [uncultured Mediterranean phage uvMED]